MSTEQCFAGLCFVPLSPTGTRFFGFSEFLAGLALMVLAWTIADVRYRFRVRTAPIPLQGFTFTVVAALGILTLMTDLWRAEGWLVMAGNLLTPASWQAILAGLFLLTFLIWTWVAFIRPPMFGKRNAERYARTLYQFILKGNPAELAVIADELTHSARSLVRLATDRGGLKNYRREQEGGERKSEPPPKVEAYANDLLLLIADRRFCRVIVGSSPATALAIFHEMGETRKYGIQVETFARNIVNEALANKDSFLYHEAEGYESGLIGYHKPLSQAMFANFQMVETIGTLLDPDVMGQSKWDAAQWDAYCRAVLMVFRDYLEKEFWNHSYTLYRAYGYIERAAHDLYKINGVASIDWDNDVFSRLRVVIKFIQDAVGILDKKGVPEHLNLRIREKKGARAQETFYDHLAGMIFEIIFAASAVKSPVDQCWWIQHNTVWGELFNFNHLDNPAGQVVKFKVRRLLYNEIVRMNEFPNFKGAKILRFCLNVLGLKLVDRSYDKDSRALHMAILAWTKRHYAWLHGYNHEVAEACLVDGMAYDVESRRIVKTYPAEGLRRQAHIVYLDVDAATQSARAE
jgi:hypothetical protein